MKKTTKFLIHSSTFLVIFIMSFGISSTAVYVYAADPLGDCVITKVISDPNDTPQIVSNLTNKQCNAFVGRGSSVTVSWTERSTPANLTSTSTYEPTNNPTPNPTQTPATTQNQTTSTTPNYAAGGLVPCDNSTGNLCDFNALMNLVNTVIKFVLYDMAIPIAAIMFAYAGFLLVTAGGETGAVTKARSIFTNTVIGLVLAVAAFVIIRTILSILGYQGSWIGFNPL